jgi:site-specific recombinase XerD
MSQPAAVISAQLVEIGQPARLGAAAERFARTTLRRSAQTQRTYRSVYERFTAWLAAYTGLPDPPLEALTADALAAYLDELEETKAPATVSKERAALNRLAKYLHTLGAIDATAILMVESTPVREQDPHRDALDELTWRRVKDLARARIVRSTRTRSSHAAATRDYALILVLGDMGLRSQEARSLQTASIKTKRTDGLRPWLRVLGKGAKLRELPIPAEVSDALLAWERARPAELAEDPLLFPRLGRQRTNGSFPDAGARLSGQALSDIIKPIMLAAGVAPELAHPHVLRHTYGSQFMRRRGAEISKLRVLMGHASTDTTSVYVHHRRSDLEAAIIAYETGPSVLEAHRGHSASA